MSARDMFGGGWVTFRPPEENPFDGRCKPALRRVCGVCAHFDGTLSEVGARPCAALGINTGAGKDAGKCRRFTRKSA